jgi:putative ABC transport system substrate-binding protein
MRRIGLAVVLAVSMSIAPLAADAQQARIPRIGMIWMGAPPSSPLSPRSQIVRFRESLGELGYVEGQSIEIESRFGGGTGLKQAVEDLIRLKVAVIVAMGTPVALAAKNSPIPVVFAIAGDPVEFELVKSLAHPGGNLTGVYTLVSELGGKRLSLLREAVPRSARIAILDSYHSRELPLAQTAARALDVQLVPLQIATADDIERAFHAAKRTGATALSVGTAPQILANLRLVAELSRTKRLPAIASYGGFAELGGLIEYHPSTTEFLRRTASYVDKILKGAKPVDLPVERPTKFELVINLKTAKALALTIPQTLLLQADQVIE